MPAVRIRTDRLWLRPFSPDDVDALHAIFVAPEVRRFLLDDQVMPRSWVAEVVAQSQADFDASAGIWSLALEDGGAPVGFAGYRAFHEPPVQELLYGLAPGAWGRGLASEAAGAALHYGFEELGRDTIPASVDVPNEASIRVLRRLGMEEVRRSPGPTYEQIHFTLARDAFEPGGRFELDRSQGA